MKSKALVAQEPGGALGNVELALAKIEDDEVLVAVDYCGVCHTDIHEIDNDWGNEPDFFPFTPGHEVLGRVVAVGPAVRSDRVGESVGIGYQQRCCGKCHACSNNWRNLCSELTPTYNGRNGGFQEFVHVQDQFSVPIPHGMDTADVAPLLCAGVTVFSPLVTNNITAGMQSAVIGMGGLGHLAVKFLVAIGCSVAVVTRDAAKRNDALKFGAESFVQSIEQLPDSSLDFIMSTVPGAIDIDVVLAKLRAKGTFCLVGASTEPLSFDFFSMMPKETTLCVSSIGDPTTIAEMLDLQRNTTFEQALTCSIAARSTMQ